MLVALRKESVDRNAMLPRAACTVRESLSARRAWIEIALDGAIRDAHGSLSARRAWIEINCAMHNAVHCLVALRKESVDRNATNTRARHLRT